MKRGTTTADIDRELLERQGFHAFVLAAWPLIDPAPFVDNWHIARMCSVLESVARDCHDGKGREVCINVPPGMSKSLIGSVLWPAWIWAWWPESKFISATWEQRLTLKHARLMKDLVLSEWYQLRWPLTLEKEADGEIINAAKGYRTAATTGGTITGHHADIQIGDDIIREQDTRGSAADSGVALEKARGFWFITMATRQTGDHCSRVLLGQRLHEEDVYGRAIVDGYEHYCYPERYDPSIASPDDERTEPGEMLCPARRSREKSEALAKRLGTIAASAQLQQSPSPLGGAVIQRTWMGRFWRRLPTPIQQALHSGRPHPECELAIFGDLAFKGQLTSDWVVLQLWAKLAADRYLIDQVRDRMSFGESKAAVRNLRAKYPAVVGIYLEDAANAPAVQDDLKTEVPGLVLEPVGGGVYARATASTGFWQAGNVVLPNPAEHHWVAGFIEEHARYKGSKADTDDQVSASSLALVHWMSRGGTRFLEAMQAVQKARRGKGEAA